MLIIRRAERLTKNSDFQEVYKKGLSYIDHLLVMRAMPDGLAISRFGFSVGHRIGNAVVRNRIKRLLRESVRLEKPKGGWDVVFIARVPAATTRFQLIHQSVHNLLQKAKLLEHENAETMICQ